MRGVLRSSGCAEWRTLPHLPAPSALGGQFLSAPVRFNYICLGCGTGLRWLADGLFCQHCLASRRER
jgi:hypothetical protein